MKRHPKNFCLSLSDEEEQNLYDRRRAIELRLHKNVTAKNIIMAGLEALESEKPKQEEQMKVTKIQVEQAIAKMDQTTERTINDGSGIPGTFQLGDVLACNFADNIMDWINERYDDDTNEYEWTESDIIDYIDETYPPI